MHTLATVAVQRDAVVAKYVVDQLIHRRLLECAAFACLAVERRGTLDLFG
jgi:hypothetical protein